ncbi:MAG: hypothetical protein IIY81_10800 [Lachnospiraceae bacterium]|nr:hypothetical protein [Lachnospiraceae bacterium]
MINGEKSKLLIKTFDGSLKNLKVKPKGINSIVEFTIQYYDYEVEESLVKAKVIFYEVVSIDFEVNLFDNCIGAELFGFYEIFQEEKKKELVEKIVRNRRDGFLYHGNYDYDETDENDMLNWRGPMEKLYENIKEYHLYQQQTEGGIYYILANRFEIIRK